MTRKIYPPLPPERMPEAYKERMIKIGDFMTERMLETAIWVYKNEPAALRHRLLVELLTPHMADINRKLGQENDVNYLAYAVEYAIGVGSS